MTTEYSGRGDPERTMALLWGGTKSPSRGPKPGLSLEQIVATAIALADAEGLAALSMRRVAERLATRAMSLYTYVPGKAELLDLMLDAVLGEDLADEPAQADWRARLERQMRADWTLYQRHPWVLQISGSRAILGPNETLRYEQALAAVVDTSLAPREMVAAVSLATSYVRGAAESAIEPALAETSTGVTNAEWWAAREAVFAKYYDGSRYPTLTAIEQAGGFAPPTDGDYLQRRAVEDFEFGLERVLDGIAALIKRRGAKK
jgi:AcrR family transcriptional regulator